jgi:hypothetical protein
MTGQVVVTIAGVTLLVGGHPTPSLLQPMPGPATRVILRSTMRPFSTTTTRGGSAGSA